MQKILLFTILLICGAGTYAQQPGYLYIEAEKGQLFYVKIKEKIHSASAGGYIIIPGLQEDSYNLGIGFPGNAFPEQRFTISLNKNDRGYQLKNLGEKGWALFDLQTMALITNANAQPAEDASQAKKTDAFSMLLSNVVNDPAVLVENKKPAAEVKKEATPARNVAVAPSAAIRKIGDQQEEESYQATYIDAQGDTIRISYPIDKSIMTAPVATPLTDNKEEKQPEKQAEKPAVTITNSDCSNLAADQDVDKLRIKLLKEEDIDTRLTIAKKYFRTKCFTVKQVKALAELFTPDENKYHFFDIAYPFIADTNNFYQLEEELKEEYYKNRFKAMIKK